MIKTIFFDLGNVITYVDHNKIFEGLAKYSDKDKKYIHDFFNRSIVRKRFDRGKLNAKEFFTSYKKDLNLKLNFNEFKKIWCSCFIGLNKEMEILLKKLKENYKLILLSNTDEIHFLYAQKKYKILKIFDDYVLSYEIGYSKPNPMIFLKALKKAKTKPGQTLYIDDLYQFVLTAKAFGIKSVQYKTMEKLKKDLKSKNVILS